MKGMTPNEPVGCIRHHLEQGGRTTEPFSDEVITQIHRPPAASPEPSTTSPSPR
jgi:hypothetical protein